MRYGLHDYVQKDEGRFGKHHHSRPFCAAMCGALQALARSVRCAAYSTAAALLRSTQSKANLFAPAFKGSKQ